MGPISVVSIALQIVAFLPTIILAAKYVRIATTIQVIIRPANHAKNPSNYQIFASVLVYT